MLASTACTHPIQRATITGKPAFTFDPIVTDPTTPGGRRADFSVRDADLESLRQQLGALFETPDMANLEDTIKTHAGGYSGYHAWTPTAGLRPPLRAPFDIKRGWGPRASDGKDLVWNYGEGQPRAEDDYPRNTVSTAPWTTDAATLAATARSLGDPQHGRRFGSTFVVGCGYAARSNRRDLAPRPSPTSRSSASPPASGGSSRTTAQAGQ